MGIGAPVSLELNSKMPCCPIAASLSWELLACPSAIGSNLTLYLHIRVPFRVAIHTSTQVCHTKTGVRITSERS